MPVFVRERYEKACWENASTDEKSNDWPIYKELIKDSPNLPTEFNIEGNDGDETSNNPGNSEGEEEEG